MKRLMILAAMFAASVAQAQVYKCNEGGTVVFSDVPCAAGKGKEVSVRPATGLAPAAPSVAAPVNSLNNPKAVLEQYERERKLRSVGYDIDQVERQLESDQKRLDAELNALKAKKAYASNNLAGATWVASISQEMLAVTQRYETKAAGDRAKLEKLRAERDSLK
jgi:hypothetical protein